MQYAKLILICFLIGLFVNAHGNKMQTFRKNYDAKYIAAAETAMWQAYYSKDRIAGKLKLGMLLIQILQKQFDLKQEEASQIAYMMASSAMLFKRGKYDDALPPLKTAYTKIKKFTDLSFDPEEVAKADLKWWIVRRTPAGKDPKVIGQAITHLYELIYGYQHQSFTKAGLLRAKAMRLRDKGKAKADWKEIEKLLTYSYKALQYGFENPPQGH